MLQTNKLTSILIAIIAVLIIIVSFQQCSINKKDGVISDYKEVQKYYTGKIDSFQNKFNQVIIEGQVAKVNDQKLIKDLSSQVFDLKSKDENQVKQVQALIRLVQNAHLDTIKLAYVDSIYVDKDDSSLVKKNTVVVPPRNFKASTKNYQIDGTVLLEGVRINSLVMPDTSSIRIVEKKTSFLKRRETVIQGIHSNPLFQTTGMQTIIKQGDRATRWQRWIKPLLSGVISGFLMYKVLK